MKTNLQKNKTFFLLFFIFSFFSFSYTVKPADTFNYSSFLPTKSYDSLDFSGQKFPLITENVPCVDINHNIRFGSRDYVIFGPVLKLQMYLYQNEYMKYPPTGLYLQYTYDGVRNFQRDNGLRETGIVDFNTRASLKQLTCAQAVNPTPIVPKPPITPLPNNPTTYFYCSLNNKYYNSQSELNYFCINSNNQTNYTVNFDGTGGISGINVSSPKPIIVMSGQTITLPSLTNVNGYIFDGWSTPNTLQCITTPCPSNSVTYQAGSSYTPNSNITLSAIWIQDANTTYTVDYDPNEADSGIPSVNTQSVNVGGSLTTASQGSLVRYGYIFNGWSLSPSGTNVIPANSSYVPTSDATLYAVWSNSGGTVNTNRINNLIRLSQPYQGLYFYSNFPVNSDIVISYTYEACLPGGYFCNSYTNGQATILKSHTNSPIIVSNDPSKPEINNLSVTITDITPINDSVYNYTSSAASQILPSNVYTVNYNANGGVGVPLAQTVQPGSSILITSGVPYKSGFSFAGWSIYQYSNSANIYPGSSYTPTGNTTLYAIWR